MIKLCSFYVIVTQVFSVPCRGPLQTNLLFGCEKDKKMANHICCHNTEYAEHWGYLSDHHVNLFSKIDHGTPTTFYDSQCGIPLFIAPIGRTFEEWKAESLRHGWPSFRPAEMVKENIVIHPSGEISSTCGTHLGHNIPDEKGERFCIDLVCIAGNYLGSKIKKRKAVLRHTNMLHVNIKKKVSP